MVGDKFLTNKFLTFDLQSVLIFILTNDIMFFIYTLSWLVYINNLSANKTLLRMKFKLYLQKPPESMFRPCF